MYSYVHRKKFVPYFKTRKDGDPIKRTCLKYLCMIKKVKIYFGLAITLIYV